MVHFRRPPKKPLLDIGALSSTDRMVVHRLVVSRNLPYLYHFCTTKVGAIVLMDVIRWPNYVILFTYL